MSSLPKSFYRRILKSCRCTVRAKGYAKTGLKGDTVFIFRDVGLFDKLSSSAKTLMTVASSMRRVTSRTTIWRRHAVLMGRIAFTEVPLGHAMKSKE